MPKGNLVVNLSEMTGDLVRGRVDIELRRVAGSNGAGGENMTVKVNGPVGTLTITGISCQTGPGTMYEVRASTPHHRKYAFFQLIQEDRDNTASDNVEFWVKPGDVKDIQAPSPAKLPAAAQAMLAKASMIVDRREDHELTGLSGTALYQQMGALRRACFLNIVKKASDAATAANCIEAFGDLLILRQDRLFARVADGLPEQLRQASMFKSAPGALHEPPPGFSPPTESFKSRDPHANLQITVMKDLATGGLAADIDIDEASGIEHGFEVIRNAVFNNRTNPYLIREFMNAADLEKRSLRPEYRFTF
jgi:hypothetical protein